MQTRSGSLASNALQTLAARVLSTVLGICTGILIARTLGPIGKGIFSAPALLLAIPLAMSSGVGAAMTFFMTKQQRSIRDLFSSLAIVLLLVTAVLWIASTMYGFLYGWNAVSITLAVVVPPSIILSWETGYYIAAGNLGRLNTLTVAYSAGTLCAIAVALFVFRAGTAGALGAWVISTYAIATVVVVDAVRAGGRFERYALRERLGMLGKMGLQCGFSDVLAVLMYRVDSFILIAVLGLAPFGIYSVAVGIGEALFLLTRPLATAISREIGNADLERASALTARTVRLGVLMTVGAGVVAFTVAPLMLSLLYGSRFQPAADALRWLIPGIIAFSSAGAFTPLFLFQLGRPGIVSAVSGITILVQSALCLVLVPRFGISGAAIASSLSYVVNATINTAYFCSITGHSAASVWIVRASDVRQLWKSARRSTSG